MLLKLAASPFKVELVS